MLMSVFHVVFKELYLLVAFSLAGLPISLVVLKSYALRLEHFPIWLTMPGVHEVCSAFRSGDFAGGPKKGPLTAAARAGPTIVRAGTEEWLRAGPNKRMHRQPEDQLPSTSD